MDGLSGKFASTLPPKLTNELGSISSAKSSEARRNNYYNKNRQYSYCIQILPITSKRVESAVHGESAELFVLK